MFQLKFKHQPFEAFSELNARLSQGVFSVSLIIDTIQLSVIVSNETGWACVLLYQNTHSTVKTRTFLGSEDKKARREAFPSVGTVLTADLLSLSDLHLNLNAQQYFWFLYIQACRVDCLAKDKGKHPATKYFTGNLLVQACSQRCHGG